MIQQRISLILTGLILSSSLVFAASDPHASNKYQSKRVLGPSQKYSGSTPIDMENGVWGANGTFGKPNPEYEAWAKASTLGVSISENTYPYSERERLFSALKDRYAFYDHAIHNWKQATEITKPEVIESGKAASTLIEPKLETARAALKTAQSANESSWEEAQIEAKRTFVELQKTYYDLHKNVAR